MSVLPLRIKAVSLPSGEMVRGGGHLSLCLVLVWSATTSLKITTCDWFNIKKQSFVFRVCMSWKSLCTFSMQWLLRVCARPVLLWLFIHVCGLCKMRTFSPRWWMYRSLSKLKDLLPPVNNTFPACRAPFRAKPFKRDHVFLKWCGGKKD